MEILDTIFENEFKKIYLVDEKGELYILKQYFQHENIDVYQKIKRYKSKFLPTIYDIKFLDNGFEVKEEFLEGKTLRNLIPIIDQDKIVDYSLKLCEGLAFLHNQGIVHRDLKPENIMIVEDGLKIIDFDISKSIKSNQNRDTQVFGSVGYAAPEQYGFSQSDARSDIYALGNVINEMSTGGLVIENLAENSFRSIILKCTQIDPKRRYQSIKETQKDLLKVKNKIGKYRIPGFRSNNQGHMIIATIGYFFIFAITFAVKSSDTTFKGELQTKLLVLDLLILTVIMTTNYLNIYDYIPFGRWKIIGIIIVWFTLFFITALIISVALN